MRSLKSLFLLDQNITFLNHGSFGATPIPVFHAYQDWQRKIENQPVQFFAYTLFNELHKSRAALGEFLHCNPQDLAFIPNATTGVNLVARSLDLCAGDEILASDHEYGACDNIWEFVCSKTGASYIKQPISIPLSKADSLIDQIWSGVTPRTKLIFLSHITSSTALSFPVEAICHRARNSGILTLIDGAHAPGQIPLNLEAIDPDFYVGNCHKWMLSPKGSGFIYTRHDCQSLVEPLIVSWGWGENSPFDCDSDYLNVLQWYGTHDPSAYLSVPTAIRFMKDHQWDSVRASCHHLLKQALERINHLTGLLGMYMDDSDYHQMGVAALPDIPDLLEFQLRLYDEYQIEIPCIQWGELKLIRISIQGYNTQNDIDNLLKALDLMLLETK